MSHRPMGKGGANQKARDFKGTWSKLINYMKVYLPYIIVALVLAAIGSALQIIGPDRIKLMTNEISKGLPALVNGVPVINAIDLDAVTKIALGLVLFYSLSALFIFV
jgi:ATP-binding cassette, subfamily B, multidrug efflux pump